MTLERKVDYPGLLISTYKLFWQILFAALVQFFVMYIYDANFFTFWILTVLLALLINVSVPVKKGFSIIRYVAILFILYQINLFSVSTLIKIYGFFAPDTAWTILMSVSIFIGILASVGRYGRGTHSKALENFSNFALFVLMIVVFSLYWWKGGLVYLIIRIPMMIFEISVANMIFNMVYTRINRE